MNKPEGVEDLDSVESVEVYQGGYADFSAILNRADTMQIRVHYLKNLSEDWKWVGNHTSEKHGNGYVAFERKG